MPVPYIFSNVPGGSSIPLSELDANFAYLTGSPSLTNLTVTGATNLNTLNVAGLSTLNNLNVTGLANVTTLSVSGSANFVNLASTGLATLNNVVLGGSLQIGSDTVTPTGITGTGELVLNNGPTFIAPVLGTPASGNLANCTGYPANSLTGVLSVSNGGTGTSTAFTPGSVVFAGALGVYSQNNAQLFWDNTNLRLGIGNALPTAPLNVQGAYTAGIGQIDVTNTGNFQQITLRDPSNPAPSKRNLALVGNYSGGVMAGNVISDGNLYLGANAGAQISILSTNQVNVSAELNVAAPVEVTAPYTPGVGQIDVLNTGNLQQITLRDPSNPAASKRNIALVGQYSAGVMSGNVISDGDLYLGSNGLSPGPQISILASNQVNIGAELNVSAPVEVTAPYTPGIGQIDVLNTGNFQQITLRDPSNPAPDKRNLALIGSYSAGVSNGIILSEGTLSLGANGLSSGAHILVLTNNNVQIPFGKFVIGDTNTVTLQNSPASANWTMTLPANAGTAGQVLTTNGSGTTSWNSVSSGPCFRATSTISQPLTPSGFTLLDMDLVDTSFSGPAAGQYNTLNRAFIPTTPGYYTITISIYGAVTLPPGNTNELFALLYKNGTAAERAGSAITNPTGGTVSYVQSATMTTVIYMNGTGDYLQAYGYTIDPFATNTPFNFSYWCGTFTRGP